MEENITAEKTEQELKTEVENSDTAENTVDKKLIKNQYGEDFDILEYIDKHDPKKTSLKKSHLPFVIMLVFIALGIIAVLFLYGLFGKVTPAEPSIPQQPPIAGKWENENGELMNITADTITLNGREMHYTLQKDNVLELEANGEIINATYRIEDDLLFILIPYGEEVVTLEYAKYDGNNSLEDNSLG